MLLIILLGVLTKLVLASTDCHVGEINPSHVGRPNVSRSVPPHKSIHVNKLYNLKCVYLFTLCHTVRRYMVLDIPHPSGIQ
jgi:hypothetical protein